MDLLYKTGNNKRLFILQHYRPTTWLSIAISSQAAMAGKTGMKRAFHTGVLTSDPRIVSKARPVPELTYEEATELAFFGATVLHPSAMQPALQFNNMGVRVKNSYNRCFPWVRCESVESVIAENETLLYNHATRGSQGFLETHLLPIQRQEVGSEFSHQNHNLFKLWLWRIQIFLLNVHASVEYWLQGNQEVKDERKRIEVLSRPLSYSRHLIVV